VALRPVYTKSDTSGHVHPLYLVFTRTESHFTVDICSGVFSTYERGPRVSGGRKSQWGPGAKLR